MNYETQIEFGNEYGDCVRACLASILEFPIVSMPNFWRQTQKPIEYWKRTHLWLRNILGVRCVLISIPDEDSLFYLEDILCIALGESKRGEHAVVWKNGLIHDPHPSRAGLTHKPDHFLLLYHTIDNQQ